MDAIYKTTDGQPDEMMTGQEALALIAKLGDRVAESYTSDDGEYEIYEIYGADETADAYPDGDPYADTLWVPVTALAAAQMGRSKSAKKAKAARKNGALGGRPRVRYELVIAGSLGRIMPRYKRYHDTLEQAQAAAKKLTARMYEDEIQVAAHPLVIYGPGLPDSGTRA